MKIGDGVIIRGLPGHGAKYANVTYATASVKKIRNDRVFTGRCISIAEKHFTLDNGRYRESFLWTEYPKLR